VNYENARALWTSLYGQERLGETKARLKVGDAVRIGKQKAVFEKGYLPNFSEQIYFVDEVRNQGTQVTVYRLRDLKGHHLKGWYYEAELCRVNANEMTFAIEEVQKERIRNGKKQFFVKWLGYSNEHNSWVNEEDCVY
jgi:hypothetical protein